VLQLLVIIIAGIRTAYNNSELSLLDILKLLQDRDIQIAEYQHKLQERISAARVNKDLRTIY
jgi:hypothetical protein